MDVPPSRMVGVDEAEAQARSAVFLDGVVRQELLARGDIREGAVTVDDFERCKREGRPVIGFNGLQYVGFYCLRTA